MSYFLVGFKVFSSCFAMFLRRYQCVTCFYQLMVIDGVNHHQIKVEEHVKTCQVNKEAFHQFLCYKRNNVITCKKK